jgi:hypothetical protein
MRVVGSTPAEYRLALDLPAATDSKTRTGCGIRNTVAQAQVLPTDGQIADIREIRKLMASMPAVITWRMPDTFMGSRNRWPRAKKRGLILFEKVVGVGGSNARPPD